MFYLRDAFSQSACILACGVSNVDAIFCKTHSHLHSRTYIHTHIYEYTHAVLRHFMVIHVDVCVCGLMLHGCTLSGQTHSKPTLLLMMFSVFVLFPSALCDRPRRLNNNDLSVLEATGAFKGLSQLKKM